MDGVGRQGSGYGGCIPCEKSLLQQILSFVSIEFHGDNRPATTRCDKYDHNNFGYIARFNVIVSLIQS